MTTFCISALSSRRKDETLLRAVRTWRGEAEPSELAIYVSSDKFRALPRAVLAYWVSDEIVNLFSAAPKLEAEGRTSRVGLQSSDNYRFLRLHWEIPKESILDASTGPDPEHHQERFQNWCREKTSDGSRWVLFAKGGSYSPFLNELLLCIDWFEDGRLLKTFPQSKVQNEQFYFRAGVTWPERTTSGYCPQPLPAGTIFSDVGRGTFTDDPRLLPRILGLHSTRVYEYLMELFVGLGEDTTSGSAARHYSNAIVGLLPFPLKLEDPGIGAEIGAMALEMAKIRGRQAAREEHTLLYQGAFDGVGISIEDMARHRYDTYLEEVSDLLRLSADLELEARQLLGLSERANEEVIEGVGPHPELDLPRGETDEIIDSVQRLSKLSTSDLIDEALSSGLSSRSVTKKTFVADRRIEVTAQILRCSASSVVDAMKDEGTTHRDLLTGVAEDLISWAVGVAFGRWRLAPEKDSFTPFAPISTTVEPPPEDVPGILEVASEPTLARPTGPSLVVQVQKVLEARWGDSGRDIEEEVLTHLGQDSLAAYLTSPNGFFEDHLSRYSAFRRRAPIYWPLSTSDQGYVIWVYWHRLSAESLFRVLSDHVDPRLNAIQRESARLSTLGDGAKIQGRVSLLEERRRSLVAFRDELSRLTELPYQPTRDDGVEISAAPLWRLVQHRGWQSSLKSTWDRLEKGHYDWAHLARVLWPDRVQGACRQDQSLAIGHDLKDLYEAGS